MLLGAIAGAIWGKTDPRLNISDPDATSLGFNDANFGTAIETGAVFGAFAGGAVGLVA